MTNNSRAHPDDGRAVPLGDLVADLLVLSPEEGLRREIIGQLKSAARVLEHDPQGEESALWRAVDAAGLLAEVCPDGPGAREPTGRGYQIVHASQTA